MVLHKHQNDTSLTLKPEGRLDTLTAPLLEEELNTSIAGVTDLTFDFADLEYVSSAGIRVIVIAYKLMHGQGSLKVVNANEVVREAFSVTGVDNIISIS